LDQIVAQDHGAVVNGIVGAVEQGHGTASCCVEDGFPGAGVLAQFIPISLPEFLPAFHSMAEPLAQLRAGSDFLHPRVGLEVLLLHAARPQTFHQDSPAVSVSGKFVRALDPNHDLRPTDQFVTSLASRVISVPARACDTGQPALAAWACCAKVASSM